MNRNFLLITALIFVLLLAACQNDPEPTPTLSPLIEAPGSTEESYEEPTELPTEEPTEAPTETPTDEPVEQPAEDAKQSTDNEAEVAEEELAISDTQPATKSRFPLAEITNDEGGPVSITGVVSYTNPFFTLGVAAPVIILEDQAGFVDRNEHFLMPVESQALAQITSDFFESPFSYSLALPIEPQGSLRDVDQDSGENAGVQVFAPAYWTNTWGDPFLEERDLHGGGWSTAYASTRISEDVETEREIVGGKFLIYAPNDQQGFPNGFGDDGLLFTEDDPIVQVPQGYTIVDMDTDPFTFDRARHQVVDLIEPEGAALDDYSELSYAEAFDALIEQLRNEYAFTEYKGLDWDAIHTDLRPAFEAADEDEDPEAFRVALRDLAWSIPDGHVSGPWIQDEFSFMNANGIGLVIDELDDGRFIVTWLLENGPAAQAGIEVGAELLAFDGTPTSEAVDNTIGWTGPYSTDHNERLGKTTFVTRFPVVVENVEVTFANPGGSQQTVTVPTEFEQESLFAALEQSIPTGFELPLEYELLEDNNLGYVQIFSFSDNELLSIQLWERMIRELNENGVPGLIIDMRMNGGGSGFLADQMAAYFFDEEHSLGNSGFYEEDEEDFYFDERGENFFYLPPEDLRYHGDVAVIVGPDCASACEFFSYDMTIADRAEIIGHYPTAGLGGSIRRVLMPEDEYFTFTGGRAVDADGNIHIEGIGVVPNIDVPITEETLLGEEDVLLETAVSYLQTASEAEIIEGDPMNLDDTISGDIARGQRIRHVIDLSEGDIVNILLDGESTSGDVLDMVLNVYDLEDTLLLSNDDIDEAGAGSGFEELEIPFDLTVVLEVSTFGDLAKGTYTLTVEQN
jgi:C-terminal processing protease CtpA/Prc